MSSLLNINDSQSRNYNNNNNYCRKLGRGKKPSDTMDSKSSLIKNKAFEVCRITNTALKSHISQILVWRLCRLVTSTIPVGYLTRLILPPTILHRYLCQHFHLQPGCHSNREIQRHLQPAEVTGMADPLTCLQSHCRYLGAVSEHHDTISDLQHVGALPQTQQDHCSHVPPRLAYKANGTDVVSSVLIMIIQMNLESASQVLHKTRILMSKNNDSGFHMCKSRRKKVTAIQFSSVAVTSTIWVTFVFLDLLLWKAPPWNLYAFPPSWSIFPIYSMGIICTINSILFLYYSTSLSSLLLTSIFSLREVIFYYSLLSS